MFAILHAFGMFVVDLFKSRWRFEAENLFLRHQLNIALRRAPNRFRLRGSDRALLIWITKLWPSLLNAAQVVQPETILRWHRAGFKVFWRWKSRNRAGRPKIDRGLRDLIQRMSKENRLSTSNSAPLVATCFCAAAKSAAGPRPASISASSAISGRSRLAVFQRRHFAMARCGNVLACV
jgi:hypothetical protein